MGRNIRRTAVVGALALAASCGSALAAPPTEPPGNSGEAPGHSADAPGNSGAAPGHQPGHQHSQGEPAGGGAGTDAPAQPEPAGQSEESHSEHGSSESQSEGEGNGAAEGPSIAGSPTTSPRFKNPTGKPKRNVPAAAEAAPETSVSGPGRSGIHKITICHKGHAITVDIHAARAHVEGHGDTYAVAGSKGRAACPSSSAGGNVGPPVTTAGGNGGPPATTASPGAFDDPATREAGSDPRPAAAPARNGDPAAVPAGEEGGAVATRAGNERRRAFAAFAGMLPFTGLPLQALLLVGLGLVAVGAALVRLASRGPAGPAR